ncbi:hypothetical protein GCM10011609_71510 [Lentzea pudingi]|uniref:Uncharacterized protein n=1 Tax=Lentzea pudingi TaxID=1789439 RepID=A0ABQ2IMG7_9PSEU|nr:hypothetical protein [Lentzea pudingi]GGN20023.1 hypothetical protein GCM10011609_71510 [Lentzea pudingi]
MKPDCEEANSSGAPLKRIWSIVEWIADSVTRFVRTTVSSGRDEFRSIVPRIFRSISATEPNDDKKIYGVQRIGSRESGGGESGEKSLFERFVYRIYHGWDDAGRGGVALPSSQRSLALSVAARLLPGREREDWLEENRAYLGDIDGRLRRRWWVFRQVLAMPRYSYTVRTDVDKETA